MNSTIKTFRPDAKVEVTGLDYLAAEMTIDAYLQQKESLCLPKRYKWIDKDGEPVTPPKTQEEIDEKGLSRVFDPNATFKLENVVECLTFKGVTQEEVEAEMRQLLEIIEHKRCLIGILEKEDEAGNTVTLEEMQKEYAEAIAKNS